MRLISYSRRRILTLEPGSVIFLGVWLMVVLFYSLTSHGPSPLGVPHINTPTSNKECTKGLDYDIVVHLDAQERIYLSSPKPRLLSAIIRRAAKLHGILFTTQQAKQLDQLPFLSLDSRLLPDWLGSSPIHRYLQFTNLSSTQHNRSSTLTELLLAGFREIDAQRCINSLPPLPSIGLKTDNLPEQSIAIRADKAVSAQRVMALIHQLEELGIRRIKLVTQMHQPT